MALQAPQYNGPRMGQMPFVPADGDAFGAAEYRQAGQLAKQGLNASLDILAAAQEQQKKCDTAVVKNATNQARIEMLDGMEKIKAERGANAQNARAEANALFDQVNRKYGSAVSGGNIERQEAFTNTMNSMRNQYELMGARHQARQMQQYEQDALDLENKAVLREVDSLWRGGVPASIDDQEVIVDENQQVLPPVNPGEETALRILRARENIAIRLNGSPAGYVKQMQDDAELQIHSAAINALIETNPRAALEYLEQPEVQAIAPPKEWAKQHSVIEDVIRTADITADAAESVQNMSSADILRKSVEDPRYRNNPTASKQFLAVADDIVKRQKTIADAERADFVDKQEEEFAASGYTKIPVAAMKDRDLFSSMMDFQSKVAKFQSENPAPDEEFLVDLYNKTPDQIGEFLSSGENYRDFLFALAGDADWKSAILEKRKGVKSGSGNSAGRNGQYGGMNLSEQIEANFPALAYSTTENGWLWDSETAVGGMEYDGSEPSHKRTKANFMREFRNRWNNEEIHAGVQPNERAENILFDIIGEYRNRTLNLDDPIYDSAMADRLQDTVDNPVVEEVNPETGATEVTFIDRPTMANGETQPAPVVHTFEKLDVEQFSAIPGMRNVSQAFRVPDAATAGLYKGIEYRPGDTILTVPDKLHKMNDSIIVLDKDLNPRWDQVSIGGFAGAPPVAAQAPASAPPKTAQMEAWEKKTRQSFEWVDYEGRYVSQWTVNGVTERYEALPDGTIRQISLSE